MRSIILVEPETPENTGFIVRLCENFGFQLRVVNPEFNLKEARKTANNAQEILRQTSIYDSVDESIKDLDFVVGTKPGKGKEVSEFQFRENTSIMFGRESTGLTNEEIEKCDTVVHIDSDYSSLNLSHAASIVMYQAYDRKGLNPDKNRLNILEEKTGEKLRELVERASPEASEIDKILGEI